MKRQTFSIAAALSIMACGSDGVVLPPPSASGGPVSMREVTVITSGLGKVRVWTIAADSTSFRWSADTAVPAQLRTSRGDTIDLAVPGFACTGGLLPGGGEYPFHFQCGKILGIIPSDSVWSAAAFEQWRTEWQATLVSEFAVNSGVRYGLHQLPGDIHGAVAALAAVPGVLSAEPAVISPGLGQWPITLGDFIRVAYWETTVDMAWEPGDTLTARYTQPDGTILESIHVIP